MSSHEDSAGEFCCAGSIFFNEVMIYQQGNKALSSYLELVSQCRNILPLAFSVLTD